MYSISPLFYSGALLQLLWCKIGVSLAESKKEFQHDVEDDV